MIMLTPHEPHSLLLAPCSLLSATLFFLRAHTRSVPGPWDKRREHTINSEDFDVWLLPLHQQPPGLSVTQERTLGCHAYHPEPSIRTKYTRLRGRPLQTVAPR